METIKFKKHMRRISLSFIAVLSTGVLSHIILRPPGHSVAAAVLMAPIKETRCIHDLCKCLFLLFQCHHMSFVDFVVLPPGYSRSVTDFWGWDAHEAQLRCPDGVCQGQSTEFKFESWTGAVDKFIDTLRLFSLWVRLQFVIWRLGHTSRFISCPWCHLLFGFVCVRSTV